MNNNDQHLVFEAYLKKVVLKENAEEWFTPFLQEYNKNDILSHYVGKDQSGKEFVIWQVLHTDSPDPINHLVYRDKGQDTTIEEDEYDKLASFAVENNK